MPYAAPTRAHPSPLVAILWGGLLCGVLDITAAWIVYGAMGLRPVPLLQGIASGLLGHRAYSGGLSAAIFGFILEFVISTGAAAVYIFASCFLSFLVRRPALAGPLYGVIVYWFMQLVVLPLSRYAHHRFSFAVTLTGMVIHAICVGPPIAFAARHFSQKAHNNMRQPTRSQEPTAEG